MGGVNVKIKMCAIFAGLAIFASSLMAESVKIDVHDRVGNGWHMNTTAYVSESGEVSGVTKLRNYNNARGFTGGLFLVVVDENLNPIYSSPVRKWGINATFFKRKKTRTASWREKIPEEYFKKAASVAIVQQHTPTKRVWKWIVANKDEIIQKALMFIDLFQKIKNDELTSEDIYVAVDEVVSMLDQVESDLWFLDNIEALHQITLDVIELSKKENGWVPENVDETKMLVQAIIDLTKREINWEDAAEIASLIDDLASMMTDKSGWIPENLSEAGRILESIYDLTHDQPMPPKVRSAIEKVIEVLNER